MATSHLKDAKVVIEMENNVKMAIRQSKYRTE